MSGTFIELGIIIVLVLLNGIFSATEIALVTLRRSRLQPAGMRAMDVVAGTHHDVHPGRA